MVEAFLCAEFNVEQYVPAVDAMRVSRRGFREEE